jgi:hypothetical protein
MVLLHAQGPSAVVRPPDEEQMSADGMTAADIAAVQDHLAMLRINSLVPTRHGILQNLLDANGAPANAINLAMAQDVYFRGMWMARSQSERRYGGDIVEADDCMEQVFRDRVRPAPAFSDAGYVAQSRPEAAAVPDQAQRTASADPHVELDPKLRVASLRSVDSSDDRRQQGEARRAALHN